MSIEDFDNALRSKLAGEIGGRQAVLVGWNWCQALKSRKYNEMVKCGKLKLEHETSKLRIVNDIVGLERFFENEGILVRVRELRVLDEIRNVMPDRVEIVIDRPAMGV